MNITLNLKVHVQLLAVCRHVVLDLRLGLLDLLVCDALAPPHCEQKYQVLHHLCQVECPLDVALKKVEEVTWMLLNPLAELKIIISGHAKDEEVNPLYLSLDFLGVLINYLPPEAKCDQNRHHSYAREKQSYVRHHLAKHRADAVRGVLDIMNAFE